MHELSVAQSLVRMAEEAARAQGARRVTEVALAVGALSGIETGALTFCYDIVTQGTLLEGSRLVLRPVPVAVYCSSCEQEVELPSVQRFRCPICDIPSGDVRRGKELEIETLKVEVDSEPESSTRGM